MHAILRSLLRGFLSSFRRRADLLVEVIALRHQLEVLQRESRTQVRLTRFDRTFWVLLCRRRSGCLGAVVVVKPDTVVRWHRKGFRLFWTWRSRPRKRGRPTILADVVRRMSRENPLWGAPRIHGERLRLGIGIGRTAVSKYVIRHPKPPLQTWCTFLRNHARCLAGVAFFVVPAFTFRLKRLCLPASWDEQRRLLGFTR